MNLNDLIKRRAELKLEIDAANALLKNLKGEQTDIDTQLMRKMDEEELTRTANNDASVSINTDTVPEVVDWDALYSHILEQQDVSLIQRRVSSTVYKELLKLGIAVPGLQPREIRRINFRSL